MDSGIKNGSGRRYYFTLESWTCGLPPFSRKSQNNILEELISIVGVSVANAQNGNLCKKGIIAFSLNDFISGHTNRQAIIFSFFESVVFALLSNVKIIEEVCEVEKITKLVIGGGETKSLFLMDLLHFVSDRNIFLVQNGDLTSLGAALLAWVKLGRYANPDEAVNNMIKKQKHPFPNWINKTDYKSVFRKHWQNWLNAFQQYHLYG
jgi:sugar (pentulose or hexulose) kinase